MTCEVTWIIDQPFIDCGYVAKMAMNCPGVQSMPSRGETGGKLTKIMDNNLSPSLAKAPCHKAPTPYCFIWRVW